MYNDERYINTKEQETTGGHEAIRVTRICMKELPETMDKREKRMYNLIWTNTLASCMSDAIYSSVTASITGFQNTKFTRTAEQQVFAGFTKALSSTLENGEFQYLQIIDKIKPILYNKIVSLQTIKNSKSHYTEARLVQLLEEKGIGRPSTFAMLVDKIQERGYVKKSDIEGREMDCNDFELQGSEICKLVTKRTVGKEHGKLIIQPIGVIVSEFLEQHFREIFNYDYTREMEVSLDKISAGLISTSSLCTKCNDQLDLLINFESKLQLKNDDNKNESSYNLGKFEQNDVILKNGKFGLYITWGTNSKSLKGLGKRSMESITLEDVEPYLNKESNVLRTITPFLSIRKSGRGDYIYYKSAKMRKPSFHSLSGFEPDYKMCDLDILKSWIREQYEI
jgi:DNA topoisomerase-1